MSLGRGIDMRITWNKVVTGLALTVLAIAIAIFAWNVIGVSVEVGLVRRIAAAREQWNQKSGGNYRAVVRVIDYNRPLIGNITVVVKDGGLAEASSRSASGDQVGIPLDEAVADTIEALFDYARAQVADLPDWTITTGSGYRYTLRVNPELGYIEEFKMDICGRGPLAAQNLECRWGFDVLDVRLGG
jgi:hypothetical protein